MVMQSRKHTPMQVCGLFFIIGGIFLFPPIISQAAVTITPPDHFVGDGTSDSGTVSPIKINIIDEDPGIYYLKAYFYPPSNTQARFGYVWNSTINRWVSTWQKNSEQLQIEVVPGKKWNEMPVKGLWQGEVSVKTDIEKSGYLGSGDYILKVRATAVTTGRAIEISTKTSIVESNVKPQTSTTTTQQKAVSEPADQPTLSQNSSVTDLSDRTDLSQNEFLDNIFLNEIMPSPEGSDTENEWIEIFNANNFEVDLTNWKIRDKIGAVKTYTLPQNSKIEANGFLILKRPQNKISLNNEGDGLELLNPSGQIIDSVDFEKAKQGQSWSKVEDGFLWTAKPTPGATNIIVKTTAQAITKTLSRPSQNEKQFLAQVNSAAPKNKNILAVIIAVFIAAGSAIIAWQIKKKSIEI